MKTAREEQLDELRTAARSLRKSAEEARAQAADWQSKADGARALAANRDETARVWDAIADALESGVIDHIVSVENVYQERVDDEHFVEYAGEGGDFTATLKRFDGAEIDDEQPEADSRLLGAKRAHAALGAVMDAMPPGFEAHAWTVETTATAPPRIKIQNGSGLQDDENARREIRRVAAALGFAYEEKPGRTGAFITVRAVGKFDGMAVEVWDHAQHPEAVDPYEGMTNADVMSGEELAEYDRADELAMDAADEERYALREDYVNGDEDDYEADEDDDEDQDGGES